MSLDANHAEFTTKTAEATDVMREQNRLKAAAKVYDASADLVAARNAETFDLFTNVKAATNDLAAEWLYKNPTDAEMKVLVDSLDTDIESLWTGLNFAGLTMSWNYVDNPPAYLKEVEKIINEYTKEQDFQDLEIKAFKQWKNSRSFWHKVSHPWELWKKDAKEKDFPWFHKSFLNEVVSRSPEFRKVARAFYVNTIVNKAMKSAAIKNPESIRNYYNEAVQLIRKWWKVFHSDLTDVKGVDIIRHPSEAWNPDNYFSNQREKLLLIPFFVNKPAGTPTSNLENDKKIYQKDKMYQTLFAIYGSMGKFANNPFTIDGELVTASNIWVIMDWYTFTSANMGADWSVNVSNDLSDIWSVLKKK